MNPSAHINLRDWTRADLANIHAIWLDYCRTAARSDMRLKPDADRAMAEWLNFRFKDSGTFGVVADSGGRPAGFLIGRIDFWETVPPILEPRNMGIIDAIYVVDEFRRQRIATMMIERAMEIMRKRNAVAVETIYDAWSDASTETWSRSGFAPWMVHAFRML